MDDDAPGEDAGMLPLDGEDPAEPTKRRVDGRGSGGTIGLANGSSGRNGNESRNHSASPRRIPLFERASARWWNPQFASPILETQYWKLSFPLLKDRFRSGLIYIAVSCFSWIVYLWSFGAARLSQGLFALALIVLCIIMYYFTKWSASYQRFYLPTSFLCTFLICLITLLIFPATEPLMGPVATMATSIQVLHKTCSLLRLYNLKVILLVYTVIPLPLYLCVFFCLAYTSLFLLLTSESTTSDEYEGIYNIYNEMEQQAPSIHNQKPLRIGVLFLGTKLALHLCIHLLGVHLFILTQIRQRKTFLKVGQSLLARKDLELETQFKDHMIQSVMPKKVADELLHESTTRNSNTPGTEGMNKTDQSANGNRESKDANADDEAENPLGRYSGDSAINMPNVRKFRPFTMNLMTNVSILFADIAGFTKMASNKTADELVNLLNDLFGRFDYLCGRCGLEKISTLGDCYYCVAGCPEPAADHAKRCVEMGLAMIIAIQQFDTDRGQAVNMRVGVSSGKVMCGMVGTKRFKFDVFSNDVTLANEMESTGVAGRVHISEATASYLDNQYILEPGEDHKGMKTYFIAGRSKEFESISNRLALSDSESRSETVGADPISISQHPSFRKVSKFRSIESASLPISRATNSTGGSLRARLLDRSGTHRAHHTCSATTVAAIPPRAQSTNPTIENEADANDEALSDGDERVLGGTGVAGTQPPTTPQSAVTNFPDVIDLTNGSGMSQSMCAIMNNEKHNSASMQGLASKDAALEPSESEHGPGTVPPPAPIAIISSDRATSESFAAAERIGGQISMELAHNSSANNSCHGSRSSGLQELGSESHSVGGLDTAISHHHNAGSLTRFDTDNRDFDQRLAQILQCGEGSFARGFWMHQDSLNRWTLRFNEPEIENEYRAHFAESTEHHHHPLPRNPIAKHHQLKKLSSNPLHTPSYSQRRAAADSDDEEAGARSADSMEQQLLRHPRYRYSGVFIDILVAVLFFGVIAGISFANMPQLSVGFLVLAGLASVFLACFVVMIGLPLLLSRKPLSVWLNRWWPRHFFGLLLIILPLGVAYFNMPNCTAKPTVDVEHPLECATYMSLNWRLVFCYMLLILIYAHCNFSQLCAWPKSLQALFVAAFFIVANWLCQHHIAKHVKEQNYIEANGTCNASYEAWASNSFGTSPFFIYELILDVLLAVILVSFLNYQFEASFRMSFFGDVQARRDTAKMRVVRDQADWLLTNIIPQHAVDSLKTNTKYSENHQLTSVLFLSITNWNEMYEENFEGGREFLRVLNEVIGDFDELLDRPEFCHVEKIKTIGATYMAASGLNPDRRRLALHPYEHIYQLIEFAIALQNALAFFNQDLLNFDFHCKIGVNIGPVTAGVIGTTKLYFDIWGDTVNIASRMYSTGVEDRIQVTDETRKLLVDRYDFEYRDHIDVKGIDGKMATYLLVGRKGEAPINGPKSARPSF
ncbi:hypothetical protein M3Y96_01228800 [Aphelenchoides besseyi]|nr:hypothetical protein M3Y96_01228800 [Aphelenchoides besseyi]